MGCISVKCVPLSRRFGLALLGLVCFGLPLFGQPVSFVLTSSLQGTLSNLAPPKGSAAGLLHLKKQLAQKKQEQALWFDTGDLLQGSPESQVLREKSPFISEVRSLGLDAVVPGPRDLAHLDSSLPWTSANLNIDGKRPFPGYRIFIRNKKKIVVLGLSAPLSGLEVGLSTGLQVEDPVQAALEWVPKVRASEQPDLLVVLYHGGKYRPFDAEDRQLRGAQPPPGALSLAEKVPGIDLLMFGHFAKRSRFLGQRGFSGLTQLAQGGRQGRDLLVVSWEGSSWGADLLRPEGVSPRALVGSLGSVFVKQMSSPLNLQMKRTSKAALSGCLNDLLDRSFADLSTEDPTVVGSAFSLVYLKGRQSGPLTGATLFKWFPFDDRQQWIRVSQRDLALLARPAAPFGRKKPPYRRIVYLKLNQKLNLDLNTLGLSAEVRERKYKVLISDYHFHGGGGVLPMLFTNLPPQPPGPSIREQVADYLKANRALPSSCTMLSYLSEEAR